MITNDDQRSRILRVSFPFSFVPIITENMCFLVLHILSSMSLVFSVYEALLHFPISLVFVKWSLLTDATQKLQELELSFYSQLCCCSAWRFSCWNCGYKWNTQFPEYLQYSVGCQACFDLVSQCSTSCRQPPQVCKIKLLSSGKSVNACLSACI